MLEQVNLSQTMTKEEFKQIIAPQREKLSVLQHQVKVSGLRVMVLFEGWGAAGKGSTLSDVILTLDPRNFKAINTLAPTLEEQRKPFLWRHWRTLPENGYFALYDNAWYPEVVAQRVEQGASKKETKQKLDSINVFERQQTDDGTLIVKFFMHISKEEQLARMDKLAAKKSTRWRVDQQDYARNKDYDKYYKAYDQALEHTNTAYAPWHIIPSHDRRSALAQVYQILVSSIEQALARKNAPPTPSDLDFSQKPLVSGPFSLVQMPTLDEVVLNKSLSPKEYKEELGRLQQRLKNLHNKIYLNKIPVVIGYEGWDAAGKGGNIRRLASALDPRGYEVIPIASPTPPEKNRQYLWRFWNHLPKDGHITIFDRTWYGRVMVERVEGFASEEEWRRAYREINEFEAELTNWGAIVLKFWLHIDKDEQLRRFMARQEVPEKQWKITDEDWRNREKWDQYEQAVNDMLRLTSTASAPWTIIESQDKLYARIKAIETVIDAIERHL